MTHGLPGRQGWHVLGGADAAQVMRWILFVAAPVLAWVTLTPFQSAATADVSALEGNALNACFFGLAVLSAAVTLDRHALAFRSLATPANLCLLAALLISVVLSQNFGLSLRRFVVVIAVMIVASSLPLMPRTTREAAPLLLTAAGIVLVLCYLGLILAPDLAIHQATDLREAHLAGDWRGIFDHKNAAAAVMALLVFIGLYGLENGNAVTGGLVTVAALLFLICTGGKSSTMLCLLAVLVSWLFLCVRSGPARFVLCMLPLAFFLAFGIGTILSDTLASLAASLPIDSTITGRDEIWRYGIAKALAAPPYGYGFSAFWGTSQSPASSESAADWVAGAVHSHNGFLDLVLTVGFLGLAAFLWAGVGAPFRNAHEAAARGADRPLFLFFFRVWLFGLYLSAFESFFLNRTDPMWFTFLFAIFGLHYLARFETRRAEAPAEAMLPLGPELGLRS